MCAETKKPQSGAFRNRTTNIAEAHDTACDAERRETSVQMKVLYIQPCAKSTCMTELVRTKTAGVQRSKPQATTTYVGL
jgi:hypothetical protein